MTTQRRPLGPILRFAQDEQGIVTVQNLFYTLAICGVGAIAVDATHFYAARSQLQVAADLAAHAALYTARYGNHDSTTGAHYPISEVSDVAAKDAAIASVHAGMPTNLYGPVIGRDDIILGRYNFGTGRVDSLDDPLTADVVEYDPASVDTALVLTHRQNESAVGSFLFRIVGIDALDVNTVAEFRLASSQDCSLKQGFFSGTRVEINSNSVFRPGFCISGPEAKLQNNDIFQLGTTVMVPGECLNLLPHRCPVQDSNVGLDEALVNGMISVDPIMARINNNDGTLPTHFQSHAYAHDLLGQSEWAGVLNGAGNRSTAPQVLAPGTLDPSHLKSNLTYQVTCTGNQDIELAPSGTTAVLKDFVLLTNCPIRFTGGPTIQNAVISTTDEGGNGANASFYGSEGGGGATLGADDNCDPANNVALVSRGSYNVAANSNYWGVHIAVDEGVDFQSNAESEGLYIVAGGSIDNNSNGDFSACGKRPGELPGEGGLSLRLIQ